MVEQNLLLILPLLPFLGCLAAAGAPSQIRDGEAWLAGLVAVAGLLILAALFPAVAAGRVIHASVSWAPSIGLDLTFRIDGLAWVFLALIMAIALLVVIYARYYMSPKDPAARFYACFLAFLGSMSGIVVSGNLMLLFVFWELTSVTSFLLIAYWHHLPVARDSARMALIVTGSGGLCLLAGLLLIGHMAGSYDLDVVLASADVIRNHALYPPALILVLLGAFTKSAQVPFHFWLPSAMTAPTPVSAFLHSATMVKAGVFLLIRVSPAMAGTDLWFLIVGWVGIATLLLGATFALFQHDLKGLLAYSTISHLGLITTLIGIATPLAIVAAIFHILNHAIFKASLFMAAGIIEHETGTRDMRRLGGLHRAMPITTRLAIVASAAMAGVPLLNGFLSKEMFFAATVERNYAHALDSAMPWIAFAASAIGVAYSLRFIVSVFFGPVATDLPRTPHEPPRWMRFPVEILVVVCLIVGILPAYTVGPFLEMAAHSVLGTATPEYSLALWHGINAPLVMSVLALAAGSVGFFLLRRAIAAGKEGPPLLRGIQGRRIFDRVLVTVSWRWARAAFRYLGTERLQPQLRLLVLLAFAVGLVTLAGTRWPAPEAGGAPFDPVFAILWLLGGACAITAAWQAKYHRFAALLMVGGAGLVTCVSFAWLSAPDLAVTQLVVEVVTTVLLLLGLRWLPKRLEEIPGDLAVTARLRRARDLVLAIACGAGLAAISYAIMSQSIDPRIATYFLENAYVEGGGTNVVNVILVDFRAFDTFGEITVLAIVALTVFALLRRFRPAAEADEPPEQQLLQNKFDEASEGRDRGDTLRDYLHVPSVIMQWMFAPIILLSLHLFFRGHDLPGGGFAGGVVLAIAFLLQYLAADVVTVEDRLRILPVRWIGFGLMVAALTGAGSWLFGYPFLTAHAQYVELPYIGKVPAATALIFDAGIYSLVVGATVLVLLALAHQSLRAARKKAQDPPETPAAGAEAGGGVGGTG
ncbi:MAG: monovalent cation/H+ antiporter subunit A [Amaricoccus sp.]|uniref:monovalent cation/H+ antiporter subunit A n=1 Tax=Amaricoccus sp. TaxID=1872485 RepID=UPI0033150C7C